MASYNPSNDTWSTLNEKTNYKTDYNWATDSGPGTNISFINAAGGYKNAGDFASQYPANRNENHGRVDREYRREVSVKVKDGKVVKVKKDGCQDGGEWKCKTIKGDKGEINKQLNEWADSRGFKWNGYKDTMGELGRKLKDNHQKNNQDQATRDSNRTQNQQDIANRQTAATNWNNNTKNKAKKAAATANSDHSKINAVNKQVNAWSARIKEFSGTSKTGQYLGYRGSIDDINNGYLDTLLRNDLKLSNGQSFLSADSIKSLKTAGRSTFKSFYVDKRLSRWDAQKQGLNPPTGGFDSKYYLDNYGDNLKKKWNDAVSKDDVDITMRYGSLENYGWNDYSTTGKNAGNRGNAPTATEISNKYKENWNKNFTDAERQNIRDNQLGLTGTRISDGKEIRTIDWEDTTGGYLEKTIGGEILKEELTEQDKFKGLGLDMMKTTIDELNKAKARERELDVYKGLPGFSEIFSINSTLSNSILGDSGVGGLLGMLGQNTSEMKEGLEDQLGAVTGVNFGSAEYNWQKWYDDTLVKALKEQSSTKGFGVTFNEETGEVTIGDERTTVYELEEDFKQNFIDNYVKPRFDQSKSMDEFISYIDTIDEETEQNIFQTQTAVNALRDVAALRAEKFYQDLESGSGYDTKTFNADFYADPTQVDKYGSVNKSKEEAYKAQKEGFAKDWETAKSNPNAVAYSMTKEEAEEFGLTGGQTKVTWGQLAYYYGLDLNDKTSFAKLHYENIGRGRGYDPARDVVTDSDIQEFVDNNVLSAVKDADAEFGDSPFLAFVTPEEFADSILEGIDPLENEEEWKKILELYGLDETTSSLDEVREIILESVRTGAAKSIREGIKYLNEKKKKPTQKRLGVEYIERDEDFKPTDDPDADALYKTFVSAGYGGTQEEFYETFMPDADRSDLELITQGLGGLTLNIGDMSDPFEALGKLGGFLGEQDGNIFGGATEQADKEKEPSYFDLFSDEKKYDDDYASSIGRGYIEDFTSFFK